MKNSNQYKFNVKWDEMKFQYPVLREEDIMERRCCFTNMDRMIECGVWLYYFWFISIMLWAYHGSTFMAHAWLVQGTICAARIWIQFGWRQDPASSGSRGKFHVKSTPISPPSLNWIVWKMSGTLLLDSVIEWHPWETIVKNIINQWNK